MPKVSVIIPVYNTEKYLEKCLDSIINQTLSDIEIICVNDCSDDNSLKILEQYCKKDKRIRIINTQKKLTSGASRNIGIKEAKGEYVSLIDSDDFVDLDFFEKLYQKALVTDADITKSNLVMIENGKARLNYYNIPEVRENKLKFNHAVSAIYKKEFLENNNILYPEDLKLAEDSVFEINAALKCNKIEIEDSVSYYYVRHKNSLNRPKKLTLDVVKEVEKSTTRVVDILESVISTPDEFFDLKKRYDYLTFFIKNKNPDEEIVEYVKSAQKNIYKSIKFARELESYNAKKRVEEIIKEKRRKKKEYIISLTSYPKRMPNLHYCLYSLFSQTKKPSRYILWLSEEEYPNGERDIPDEVLRYKEFGLEIEFVKNIKSYKKLIPVLEKYPEDTIITADDDILYPFDWFEKLILEHKKYPENILCHRAHKITFNNDEINLYKYWQKDSTDTNPSFLNMFTGVGGVLYPKNSLYKDVLNEDLFMKFAPNADDLWFWAMAVLKGTKIKITENSYENFSKYAIFNKQNIENESLYETNIVQNDIQLKNILNYYPEILEKIKEERGVINVAK